VQALQGWRREVFGNDAIALKNGRVAIGVEGKRIRLIPAA
jgi:ribonuclease D